MKSLNSSLLKYYPNYILASRLWQGKSGEEGVNMYENDV